MVKDFVNVEECDGDDDDDADDDLCLVQLVERLQTLQNKALQRLMKVETRCLAVKPEAAWPETLKTKGRLDPEEKRMLYTFQCLTTAYFNATANVGGGGCELRWGTVVWGGHLE
eukprot:1141710-Amphidinium_carterae.1